MAPVDHDKERKYGPGQWTASEIGGTVGAGIFFLIFGAALVYLKIWPAIRTWRNRRRKDPRHRDLELQPVPQQTLGQRNMHDLRTARDAPPTQTRTQTRTRQAPPCRPHPYFEPPQPSQRSDSYRQRQDEQVERNVADANQLRWPTPPASEPIPDPSATIYPSRHDAAQRGPPRDAPSRRPVPQAASSQAAPSRGAPSYSELSRNVSVMRPGDMDCTDARESLVSDMSADEQPYATMPTVFEQTVNPYTWTPTPRTVGPEPSRRQAPRRQASSREAPQQVPPSSSEPPAHLSTMYRPSNY